MDLHSLRNRLARAAAAAEPRASRPHRLTTPEARQELSRLVELTEVMLASAAVLAALERWAQQRPGYVPMPAPTILYEPGDADVRMAGNNPQLAGLAEPSLTHSPDIRAARLVQLLAQYRSAGIADDGIELAVADFRARLAAYEATGAQIGSWYAKFLDPIVARNSAAQSIPQKEIPCP